MARFEGFDFYDVSSLLTEEERMVRDTVRTWVEDRLMPVIGDAYIGRKFPRELIPELAELGVLGANLPEEYGCAALNNVSYGLIMQELERGDSGIRSFASVQGALVMYPIYAFGSEEHRKTWLPKLAAGSTAPRCGSPTARWPTSPSCGRRRVSSAT
jgi:glutaryl-CoA dehydrogenase